MSLTSWCTVLGYCGGKFVPGMIGTAFSFIDKAVSSLGNASTGIILGLLGFVSIEETAPNATLFWGILIFYFAVPAIGHVCSVVAMKFYPITEEVYADMIAKKNETKANGLVDPTAEHYFD